MKKYFLYIILIIISFLLQTTVFMYFNLGGTVPNIMLIVPVSLALLKGSSVGSVAGFFSGLLMDLVYSSILGMYAIIFVIICYLAGKLHDSYYKEDITFPAIALGVSDLIYGILMFIILFVTRHETAFLFYFRRIILPEIIYTVIVGIFIYKLISVLDKKFNNKGSDNLID